MRRFLPTPPAAGPKPRMSASFAAVAATLLAFVVILGLNTGVRGNFSDPGGGRAPSPSMPPRCFALSYRGTGAASWLPRSVRLTGEVAYANTPSGPLYRAIDQSGAQWEWRPAGPDSIDIAHYHSPMIRIPVRGKRATGRVGAQGYYTMWAALFGGRDGQVFAREVQCSSNQEAAGPP
jgi:hypothetical protein